RSVLAGWFLQAADEFHAPSRELVCLQFCFEHNLPKIGSLPDQAFARPAWTKRPLTSSSFVLVKSSITRSAPAACNFAPLPFAEIARHFIPAALAARTPATASSQTRILSASTCIPRAAR